MPRKTLLLLIGAGILALAAVSTAAFFGVRFLRGLIPTPTPVPKSITLCDRDASGLCVISFSTNSDNQMVINLQLADEEFPRFYAVVTNRGAAHRFTCTAFPDLPPSGFCTGDRTPLGEPLTLRLYASKDDALIAEGDFVLMALALPTFSNATGTPTEAPAPTEPTAIPLTAQTPGPPGGPVPTFPARTPVRTSTPTRTRTPTPGTGYP